MNDFLYDSREEIKRADHLIFVSLKYTRTVDVLKHVIDRLINSLNFMFSALLDDLKEKQVIDEVPVAPIQKAKLIREHFEENITKFADLFIRLRRISMADFSRAQEFRRHVTMTVVVEEDVVEIDIDTVTDWYKEIRDLFEDVRKMIDPEEE
ncbi:hypothetical protein ACFL0V_06560 [Nanoarchaeota archaeon]